MTIGRKPKPTHLKLVAGNPGRRPINKNEPKPQVVKPEAPAHLNKFALAEWNRVTDELFELGIITRLDVAVIAAYCQSYGRGVEAELELRTANLTVTSATGQLKQHPLIGIINTANRDMHRFAAELGLSPTSRPRIHGIPKPKDDKAASFF